MSWFDACRLYKEQTGRWVVPRVGTQEHDDITKLFYDMKYPNTRPCEAVPVPEKKRKCYPRPLKREPTARIVAHGSEPTEAEVETLRLKEEFNARMQAEEKKVKEALQLELDAKAREFIQREYLASIERKRLIEEVRTMRPAVVVATPRRYNKKTGQFTVGVGPGRIISFD